MERETDWNNWVGTTGLSRRQAVLTGAVAGGFALAVRPVCASTIITPAEDMTAGDVSITARDRAIPGYRAKPLGKGPFPVVLVVHEIFGVHEHIRDITRRFARAGFYAIAPDLYVRQGDVRNVASIDAIRPIVQAVPDMQVMADLDSTLEYAAGDGGAAGRAGVTGFCWGGRITWLYAANNPALKAGVAWYGQLTSRTPSPLQPHYPLELAGAIRAPVLGLYGGQDQGIPLADVEAMRAKLRSLGNKASEIVVYPDAPHGFNADYRPSYRADAAKDAWGKCVAWFGKYLG